MEVAKGCILQNNDPFYSLDCILRFYYKGCEDTNLFARGKRILWEMGQRMSLFCFNATEKINSYHFVLVNRLASAIFTECWQKQPSLIKREMAPSVLTCEDMESTQRSLLATSYLEGFTWAAGSSFSFLSSTDSFFFSGGLKGTASVEKRSWCVKCECLHFEEIWLESYHNPISHYEICPK